MSKELYKQESAKKLKQLLTHFLQEKDNDWKTVRKEFSKKIPEIVENVCGDEYTPEQKQEILDYIISNKTFEIIIDTVCEVGGVSIQEGLKEAVKELEQFIVKHITKPRVDGGVSDKQQAMLDDIYQMWKKYSSMKKGKFLKEDLFDTRKRRYSNEECYNFIQNKHPKLDHTTIAQYIKNYNK